MAVTIDGTNGITTPDLESTGPIVGTTGTFSGAVSGTTGTFSGAVSGTTGTFSGAVQASGVATNLYPLVSGTAKAWNWNGLTVNKEIEFGAIPSWVNRITMLFNGISTSGTSPLQVQLGTVGGILTSGYIGTTDTTGASTGSPTAITSGLGIGRITSTTYARYGQVVFVSMGSQLWSGTYLGSSAGTLTSEQGACAVTLSGSLTTVRITTMGGTDNFDAGSINILYE